MVKCIRGLFAWGLKPSECDIDHAPPSSAPRLSVSGGMLILPPYVFMAYTGTGLPLVSLQPYDAEQTVHRGSFDGCTRTCPTGG